MHVNFCSLLRGKGRTILFGDLYNNILRKFILHPFESFAYLTKWARFGMLSPRFCAKKCKNGMT